MLRYSSSLASLIESYAEIGSGSEEIELWACSVCALEKIRELITKISGKKVCFAYLSVVLFCFLVSSLLLFSALLLNLKEICSRKVSGVVELCEAQVSKC